MKVTRVLRDHSRPCVHGEDHMHPEYTEGINRMYCDGGREVLVGREWWCVKGYREVVCKTQWRWRKHEDCHEVWREVPDEG